jgi:DNA-binding NtrC family response regulator
MPAAALPRGNGELILVVDDEEDIRKVTQQILASHGYEVITARDGNDAILQFSDNANQIQLVITDIMMPGIDGGTLVKSISRMKPTTKIITTSGLDSSVPEGTLFLKKPASAEELLVAVHEVLKSK